MKKFFSPAFVLSSVLAMLASGCADKPLPVPPGTDILASTGGNPGGQTSQEGGDQAYGIPSPLSSSGSIKEDTMTGSSDSNNFSNSGSSDSNNSRQNNSSDDFIPDRRGNSGMGDSRQDGKGRRGSGGNGGSGFGGDEFAAKTPFHTSEKVKDIFFSYDKYDLTEQSKSILKKNANWLKENPNVRVEIAGHCDERGTNNYNLSLGERRAQSTKNYLITLGVSKSRIYTISYGEERPFCVQSGEDCWWQNRRGHFTISK